MGVVFQTMKRVLKMTAPPGSRWRLALRSLRRLVGLKPPASADLPTPPKGPNTRTTCGRSIAFSG